MFVMGHPGVGKSTELWRLIHDKEVKEKFFAIRLSATEELDPTSFDALDFVLVMMIRVAEAAAKDGQWRPSEDRMREIFEYFAEVERTSTRTRDATLGAEAGAGVSGESAWARITGLFARLRGEIRFGTEERLVRSEHRMRRLTQLIEPANRLLDDCAEFLRKKGQREWLVVFDDFEKPGIPPNMVKDLFLNNASVLKALRLHMILTIPVALTYSTTSVGLPFAHELIPDTPVFTRDHKPHRKGRQAVREVIEERVAPDLFGKGQLERLIAASGGNLRDLFFLVAFAADTGFLRKSLPEAITGPDADRAIVELRVLYEHKLGQSPFDDEKITYDDKARLLVDVYNRKPTATVPNPVLYSLLRASAVQEFDEDHWYGVHPMVVEILKAQGGIKGLRKGKSRSEAKGSRTKTPGQRQRNR
jgi:hypothetical protein